MRLDGDPSTPLARRIAGVGGLYHAFVFDLDGTLVDSRPAIEKAAQMAIAQVAPGCHGRMVTAVIGPPIRQMFKTVLGELDASTLDRVVAAFRQAYDSGVCLEVSAYPGVAELLAKIAVRGANSFVLTNKPYEPTRQILLHLGIEAHIREIVTPDSPSHPFAAKSEALRALLRRYSLAPASTVMVGDSMDDASAAAACGVRFAAAIYGYGRLESGPEHTNWVTIRHPADMLSLLE